MFALLQVVVKEFLQLRQDRKMIPVLVVGPVMQLLALGFAANVDVNRIPLLLVDQDRTAASRQLLERFTGSGYFELVGAVDGDLRRRYEMIFSRRGGVAVVAVRGGTCQGCHMHVPPQLFNELKKFRDVRQCPNCHRILYWRPEVEAETAVTSGK